MPGDNTKQDPLSRGRSKRLCLECNEVQRVDEAFSVSTDGKYSDTCLFCQRKRGAQSSELVSARTNRELTSLIAGFVNRTIGKSNQPDSPKLLDATLSRIHAKLVATKPDDSRIGDCPQTTMGNIIGDQFLKIIDETDGGSRSEFLKFKYVKIMADLHSIVTRHKPAAIDLEGATENEVSAALLPIAIEHIRENPMVLKSLLRDVGYEVIESSGKEVDNAGQARPAVRQGA